MTVHNAQAAASTLQGQPSCDERVADIYLEVGMPTEAVRACVTRWPQFAPVADAMDRKIAEGDIEAGE